MSGEILKKLLAIQKDVGVVEKDGKNEDQGYTFQQWEDIALEIRQAMNKHGVSMDVSISGVPIREAYQTKNGSRAVSTLVPLRITFTCEDGSFTSADWYGESADYSDKSTGKAVTSGVKGYLLKRFLVPVKPPEGESDEQEYERGGSQSKEPAKVEKPAEQRRAAPPSENGNGSRGNSTALKLIAGEQVPPTYWKLSRDERDKLLGDTLTIERVAGKDRTEYYVRQK